MRFAALALALAMAGAPVTGVASRAHVHGAASLDVAVEDGQVTVRLEAPLEDFVGFERAPRDERERAAVAALRAFLASDAAIRANAEAKCRRTASRVEIHEQGAGHVAVEGELAFRCGAPDALAHLEVGLFARHPRLKRIDARIATPRGQSAQRLTPGKPRLAL